MIELKATIINENGLHMRPSAKIVDIANSYKCSIFISKNGNEINAKHIMEIVTLTATKGTLLIIKADGIDEEKAANHIKNFIEYDCTILRENHYDTTRYKKSNR